MPPHPQKFSRRPQKAAKRPAPQIYIIEMLLSFVLLVLLIFGGAVFIVYQDEQKALEQAAQHVPEHADVALVLGNAVNRNGVPNPCLRTRVEAGVWLLRSGKADMLMVTGGTDSDGSNEAGHMREMALELGVPSEKILMENRSESTLENMAFSMPQLEGKQKIIIVSDAFHLARAKWLADCYLKGKQVQTFASGSCGDSEWTAWRKRVRETLAWVKALVVHR